MSDFQPPEGEGYDVQRLSAEQNKPFWFRWNDRWWMLDHIKNFDFKVQHQVESFDFSFDDGAGIEAYEDRINAMFTLIMGSEQGGDWAQVPNRPVTMMLDVLREWMNRSGVQPGEAPASASSSPSTGRPSKRTSKGSTGSGSRKRSKAGSPAITAAPPDGTPPVSS